MSLLYLVFSFRYGAKLVADGIDHGCTGDDCLTGGKVLAVFFSIIMGSIALGQLAPPLAAFTAAKAAVAPMFEVIDRTPLIDGLSTEGLKKTNASADSKSGAIELVNINFAYPSRPDIQVCKGYSLSIKAGETVALCGASGCGKR
jgi:ATP-binding cassette subfamily B (MDR/TAP) protein 1